MLIIVCLGLFLIYLLVRDKLIVTKVKKLLRINIEKVKKFFNFMQNGIKCLTNSIPPLTLFLLIYR